MEHDFDFEIGGVCRRCGLDFLSSWRPYRLEDKDAAVRTALDNIAGRKSRRKP